MTSIAAARELFVVGLNHKTAPLAMREQLAFTDEQRDELVAELNSTPRDGVVLLSTCNRVELYSVKSLEGEHRSLSVENLSDEVISRLARQSQVSESELREHLYIYRGDQALTHLFRVAASLDSLVVGEAQILGQLREALEASSRYESAGAVKPMMERAFAAARRIRRETGIGQHVVSVSSVAVRLARHIFEDLSERSVLLVGAGEMGELAARHLCQEGVKRLLVANRSLSRAVNLAEKLGGHPRDLTELPQLLEVADIVITSTGSRTPIITADLAQRVIRARKYRPLFLIDIAVPRDVAPEVNKLDNIYVYDVDDLMQISQDNLAQREAEAQAAETLVLEEIQRYHSAQAQRSLGPTIVEVRERVHQLKSRELDWAITRAGDRLTEDQEQLLKRFGDRLANKILHDVITGIKRHADSPERPQMLEIVSQLFALDAPGKADQQRSAQRSKRPQEP